MRGGDRRRRGIAAATAAALLGALALAATAGPAGAKYPESDEPLPNPCVGPAAANLLCPDLRMAPPSELFVTGGHGRVLLHATNDIESRGEGPLEIHGTRSGKRTMTVRQGIYNTAGKRKLFETHGSLVFYFIPGQGHYWKFHEAARFELWSLDESGTRVKMVRTGPKLNYCFRDLEHTKPGGKSPGRAIYPGCSQDPKRKGRILGTSVGWSDVYPSTYYQNWVNVQGLSGCFDLVHRADPENYLFENDESNNEGVRRVLLPPVKGRVSRC